MSRIPKFFGIHAEPTLGARLMLGALPFVLLIAVYLTASHLRLSENPQDKILPSVSQMIDAVRRMALEPDTRTGQYILWADTLSSLKRLGMGIGFAAVTGLLLGLNMGLFSGLSGLLRPFVTFMSIVPPLAILPILFISFGVDELAKVMLIFLGTFPVITRDIYFAARSTPKEEITKAFTLGASQLGVVYRIVLPQVLPRLIDTVRLSQGAAWLFLIASEAIASTDGLGYRIFLVRRYLAMDVIIPYVFWITFIGFSIDWILTQAMDWVFPWRRT